MNSPLSTKKCSKYQCSFDFIFLTSDQIKVGTKFRSASVCVMQIQNWVWVALVLVLTGCRSQNSGIELKFSEQDIRDKLEKKFPKIEKIYGVVPVTIEKPEVSFVEGEERFKLKLMARVDIPLKGSYHAMLTMRTGVLFDQKNKALQLTEIEVEEIEASKLPKKYESALSLLATVLAQKYLDGQEVYRLKETDLKKKAARYLIQNIQVKDDHLVVTLGL